MSVLQSEFSHWLEFSGMVLCETTVDQLKQQQCYGNIQCLGYIMVKH